MNTNLTIQQVAAETNLSVHTLRYYERIGLINPVGRAANGHRRYTPDDIGWIEFLKCLRATGMPIADMKRYSDLQRLGDGTLDDRMDLLRQHRTAMLDQIQQLNDFLAVIDHKIDYYSNEYKPEIETENIIQAEAEAV